MTAASKMLADGPPLARYGKAAFRHQVGAIMQDDLLYAGSIAENIALFDPDIDMERVREVAALASIADGVTASLDPQNHERVGAMLAGIPATRIIVTDPAFNQIPARIVPVHSGRAGELPVA